MLRTSAIEIKDFEVLLSANTISHEFNEEHIMDMMNILKSVPQVTGKLDFENIQNIDHKEVYILTGRTVQQFNTMLEQVLSLLRTCNESKTALASYLIKLRTGESDTRLADMFHMSRKSLFGVVLLLSFPTGRSTKTCMS